jgi:hypothetical protein
MTRTSTVDTRITACGLAAGRSINVRAASTTRSQHRAIVGLVVLALAAGYAGLNRDDPEPSSTTTAPTTERALERRMGTAML